MYKFSTKRLERMRIECNKYIEAVSLGKEIVNKKIFIYWMVSHFYTYIKELIDSIPNTPRSDILKVNLDR